MSSSGRYTSEAYCCKAALEVQDGCNPSGITLALYEVCCCLNGYHMGTSWVSRHPAVRLFLDKLVNLSTERNIDYPAYNSDFDYCHKMAESVYE